MRLRYKIWLDQEGKAFGTGPAEILQSVDRCGSLSAASRELGISYTKAWRIIKQAEERLGLQLLQRESGGKDGGASVLTGEGRAFLQKYRDFSREVDAALRELYQKYFPEADRQESRPKGDEP